MSKWIARWNDKYEHELHLMHECVAEAEEAAEAIGLAPFKSDAEAARAELADLVCEVGSHSAWLRARADTGGVPSGSGGGGEKAVRRGSRRRRASRKVSEHCSVTYGSDDAAAAAAADDDDTAVALGADGDGAADPRMARKRATSRASTPKRRWWSTDEKARYLEGVARFGDHAHGEIW